MLYILIALIPAIMWGIGPLLVSKFGGKPVQQILGTTIGAIIFSITLYFFTKPEYTSIGLVASFISGAFWTLGQFLQYKSFEYLEVSKAMPISSGLQLLGTSIIGVLIFKDWNTSIKITFGFIALLIIIIGIFFTSYQQRKHVYNDRHGNSFKAGLIVLVVSSVGYIIYAIIGEWFGISGWTSILPQSIGMFITALIFSINSDGVKRFNKTTMKNIIVGITWGIGNLGLLVATNNVGVATSFSLSQMGIVISVLGGIWILKERKTRKELIATFVGVALILLGGFLIGYIKTL